MTHQPAVKGYNLDTMTESADAHKRLLVTAADAIIVLAAYGFAFLLRFDFILDAYYFNLLVKTAPYALLTYALTSYAFGVNRGLRHFASFGDVVNILKAVAAGATIQAMIILFVTQGAFPRSVLVLAPILTFIGVAGSHAVVRYAKGYWQRRPRGKGGVRIAIIVGAGDMGEIVYRHMRTNDAIDYRIVAFVDEDKSKWGLRLHGVPVVGGIQSLTRLLDSHPIDEIIIAAGRRRGHAAGMVAEALQGREKRPAVSVVPTLEEMLRSPKRADPRKVQPVDLLNRREVSLDAAAIARCIHGRVILVTGAGGTIGGELARQIAAYRPKTVVLLENHATALFYREAEIRHRIPGVEVVGILGDVRDQALLERVFRDHRPNIVFHAAAHKHVAQLETNVHEGISNNLIGTYRLAAASDRHGVETFLLISTDKAVRPSCVMGATKRAAEIVVSSFAKISKTRFVAVRFGNVLGSSGSVLKIFQEQIELGRPITVTHPDVTRYFMTVEEAVGLVLQASALAKGGEIFVLKMGDPVRIMDMARNLVVLSGLEPGKDIKIHITGLKPGEKIAEELVEDPAGQEQSEHPDISVLRAENQPLDGLSEKILALEILSRGTDQAAMLRGLKQLVPTFTADKIHDAAEAPAEDKTERREA
jgi:FlaA1/EpsC-like NDP-sugar epimerase